MAVLKYWGDPDDQFNLFQKRQQKLEAEEKKAYEKLMRQEQIERRMLGYESEENKALTKNKSQKTMKGTMGRNSTALMPLTENEYNLRAK